MKHTFSEGTPFPPIPPFFLFIIWLCVVLLLTRCSSNDSRTSGDSDTKDALGGVKNQDLNPGYNGNDALSLKYADGFELKKLKRGFLLHVFNPFNQGGDTLRYILLRDNQKLPAGFSNEISRVDIPVHNSILLSATHIGMVNGLDKIEAITGISDTSYVFNKKLRSATSKGDVIQVGEDANLNQETVINRQPEVVMASGFPQGNMKNFGTLMNAGIPVIFTTAWMENTPLARAEWIKLFGVLYGEQNLARKLFNTADSAYQSLKAITHKVSEKPKLIVGLPFKGSWFVSGGDSYAAQFYQDAGARYPWDENRKQGSLKLDFEAVYPVALEASYWLAPGMATQKSEILAKDSRITDFKAFKNGNIYNNTRQKIESGGNDYWESGVIHPHIVLKDLIRIFHPELQKEHELTYFEKIR